MIGYQGFVSANTLKALNPPENPVNPLAINRSLKKNLQRVSSFSWNIKFSIFYWKILLKKLVRYWETPYRKETDIECMVKMNKKNQEKENRLWLETASGDWSIATSCRRAIGRTTSAAFRERRRRPRRADRRRPSNSRRRPLSAPSDRPTEPRKSLFLNCPYRLNMEIEFQYRIEKNISNLPIVVWADHVLPDTWANGMVYQKSKLSPLFRLYRSEILAWAGNSKSGRDNLTLDWDERLIFRLK